MKELKFKWNRTKASNNIQKHGVSFKEAQSVFYDDFAIEFFDDNHSEDED